MVQMVRMTFPVLTYLTVIWFLSCSFLLVRRTRRGYLQLILLRLTKSLELVVASLKGTMAFRLEVLS